MKLMNFFAIKLQCVVEHACTVSTRRLLASLGLVLGVTAVLPAIAQAPVWQGLDAVTALVGANLQQGQVVKVDLPLVSEDGSSVALSIVADQPLAQGVFIQHLDIFAPANPTPEVASFEFGPEMSPLNLGLRIRLSESQTVVVVARTSDGRAFVSERAIRITTSGCIAGAASPDKSQEMKERVRLPKSFVAGKPAEVLTMITHPMQTGLVPDASGKMPEIRIIENFNATLGDQPVIKARFYRSLAANPYVRFTLVADETSELTLTWSEDTGRQTQHKAKVMVSSAK